MWVLCYKNGGKVAHLRVRTGLWGVVTKLQNIYTRNRSITMQTNVQHGSIAMTKISPLCTGKPARKPDNDKLMICHFNSIQSIHWFFMFLCSYIQYMRLTLSLSEHNHDAYDSQSEQVAQYFSVFKVMGVKSRLGREGHSRTMKFFLTTLQPVSERVLSMSSVY